MIVFKFLFVYFCFEMSMIFLSHTQICYERVARGMLHNDRLTLALLLCKIHLKGVHNEPGLDSEFQFFLRGKDGMLNARAPTIEGLNQDQLEALSRLATR